MRTTTRYTGFRAAAGLAVALVSLLAGGMSRAASVAVVRPVDRTGARLGRTAAVRLVQALRARGVEVKVRWRSGPVSRPAAVRRAAVRHGVDALITIGANRRGRRWLLAVRLCGSDGRLRFGRRLWLRRPRLSRRAAGRLAARIQRRLGRGVGAAGSASTATDKATARFTGTSTVASTATPMRASRTTATFTSTTTSRKTASASASGGTREVAGVSERVPGRGGEAGGSGSLFSAGAELDTVASTNLFLDGAGAWDLLLRPRLDLGADISRVMSVGYRGEVNRYQEHEDLMSHWHQVRLVANPAWGTPGRPGTSELLVQVTAETLRNQPAYETINHVRTSVDTHVQHTFTRWLRWSAGAGVGYRFFYQDRPSDTLDAWVSTRLAFVLPSHTTVAPRVHYGLRAYPNPVSARTRDFHDQQVSLGLHIGQALWKRAGLQLGYTYVMTPGSAGLVERNLTRQQFNYLGLDFCCGGHRAGVTFKQVLGGGVSLGLSALYQERRYDGWPAVDDAMQATGSDRHDHRLVPAAFVAVAWRAAKASSRLGFRAGYRFVRQWSNSSWYDARAHVGSFSLWGSL